MGMARRSAGGGQVTFRAMVSFEPWTIGGCGYPNLLATGEVCEGETIHDRQHPHDLFMELAAQYKRPLGKGLRLELYGGPVGEPALGPVAFMHRVSGSPNPIAPMTHHWFDSTHITFGVVTAGLYAPRWKVEGRYSTGASLTRRARTSISQRWTPGPGVGGFFRPHTGRCSSLVGG